MGRVVAKGKNDFRMKENGSGDDCPRSCEQALSPTSAHRVDRGGRDTFATTETALAMCRPALVAGSAITVVAIVHEGTVAEIPGAALLARTGSLHRRLIPTPLARVMEDWYEQYRANDAHYLTGLGGNGKQLVDKAAAKGTHGSSMKENGSGGDCSGPPPRLPTYRGSDGPAAPNTVRSP